MIVFYYEWATTDECDKVLNLLDIYERASSQKMNKNNTTFFSKSAPKNVLLAIKESLVLQEITQYEKYLGLPSLIRRGKKQSFNYIKERIWKKLQG